MIDITQQEKMLISIGNAIKKKIEIYAIGGTAMMLRNIKDATLDVDLVFDKKEDREEFVVVLKKLGAKPSNVTLIYGLKENTPLTYTLNNARFDLFMNKIITSTFSNNMKERAKQIHEFGNNLIVKPAFPEDVIIMKSATARNKDDDDIVKIIQKNKIDWKIIVGEAKEQVKLGNETAVLALGEKLERLNNLKLIETPKETLDSLWNLLKKQIDKKIKKKE